VLGDIRAPTIEGWTIDLYCKPGVRTISRRGREGFVGSGCSDKKKWRKTGRHFCGRAHQFGAGAANSTKHSCGDLDEERCDGFGNASICCRGRIARRRPSRLKAIMHVAGEGPGARERLCAGRSVEGRWSRAFFAKADKIILATGGAAATSPGATPAHHGRRHIRPHSRSPWSRGWLVAFPRHPQSTCTRGFAAGVDHSGAARLNRFLPRPVHV